MNNEKRLDIKKYIEELDELEKVIYEIEFGKKKGDKNG